MDFKPLNFKINSRSEDIVFSTFNIHLDSDMAIWFLFAQKHQKATISINKIFPFFYKFVSEILFDIIKIPPLSFIPNSLGKDNWPIMLELETPVSNLEMLVWFLNFAEVPSSAHHVPQTHNIPCGANDLQISVIPFHHYNRGW